MGFCKKAKTTNTTTTTRTKKTSSESSLKLTQYTDQRICPLVTQQQQEQQQQKKQQDFQLQQQTKQRQHPPTPTQLQQQQQEKTTTFSKGNLQKAKHKFCKTCQIRSKDLKAAVAAVATISTAITTTQTIATTTITCHCVKRQQNNRSIPNEVSDLLWRRPTLHSPSSVAPFGKLFRNPEFFLYWTWLCLLSLIVPTSLTSFTTATSIVTTTAAAVTTTTYATIAFLTFAVTIASVSGVGAAAAATYANRAAIYETTPIKLAAIDAEGSSNEHAEGEPGEELMYAYYKRAQRHQLQQLQQRRHLQQQHQQHQHQHVTPPTDTSQEMNFDDIVPTLDIVSILAPSKDFAPRTPQKRSEKSTPVAVTKSATLSANLLSSTPTIATTTINAATDDEKCDPKVLDEVPTEPYYDFSDVAEDAARQFTEFLASKFPSGPPPVKQNISDELRQEVTRRAYGIASYALNEDDNLLAFAIAAPSVHTVVVKFRNNVTVPPEQAHNKAFLGSYWRELSYAWNSTEGSQEWGAPFRDCNLLKKRWLWPFRISYAEYKFKIVAAAFIAADEDVCNDGLEEVFGRRHGCDRNTTFCLLTENKPMATRDVYTCICREKFYLPNSTLQGFRGDLVEISEGFDNYSCIPCPGGCTHCDQNGECILLGEPPEIVSLESLLKVSIGSVLGACILCCIVLSVIVFRQRKSKAIAIGMWTVLETILLGIILLYASVAVHFFPASTERCLLEPWLRELGFIVFYGAIILKLYRHLVDFRTRKAHRWVLRDVDLLKYLGIMVFAVICYLAGFTASSLDLLQTGHLESLRELNTNTCLPLKWEYVTQVSEVLILLFGMHLSVASRNANTQFRERQFLAATLTLEFFVSTAFYVFRFFYLQQLSPSTIFLALFLRSQLTNTIALGLIFVPKLWYQHKQVRSLAHDLSIRLPVDAFKGSHDVGQRLGGGYAGLCLGDPDIGELTISEMSPEDIRAELKRLYTQLEILKNKTLRQDNPHISKRRGGRKAGHRRFSLQALSAKHRSHKHHQDIEITEAEPSRTPEDSVCSVEGPTDAEISGISHSMLSHSVISHSIVSHSK